MTTAAFPASSNVPARVSRWEIARQVDKVQTMEEVLPPQTESGAGFESTRVRQFTVFLENKVGRLQMLVRSLEQGAGKIVAMSIQDSADTALVRLICSEPDEAARVLEAASFPYSESDLLAVELPKTSRQ